MVLCGKVINYQPAKCVSMQVAHLKADDGRRESQMDHMWADTLYWQGLCGDTFIRGIMLSLIHI